MLNFTREGSLPTFSANIRPVWKCPKVTNEHSSLLIRAANRFVVQAPGLDTCYWISLG